jgi:hypothetical protein
MINIAQRVSMLIIAILAMSILAACGISKGDLEDLQATSVVNTNNAMATSEAKTASMLKTAEANDDEEKAELMAQLTPTIDAEAQGECTVGENKPVDGTYKFCEDVDGEFTPTTPTPESTETPTPTATIAPTQTPAATPTAQTEARVAPTATPVPTQVATTAPAPQAVVGNADVRTQVKTWNHNGWTVTTYDGVTTQMDGWFTSPELKFPEPQNWGDFPNVDNPTVGFSAADGLEYGLDERNVCDNDVCDIVVDAGSYHLVTADYDLGFIKCQSANGIGCGFVIFNVGEVTANFENVHVNNGFSLTGRYWNGDTLPKALQGLSSHVLANMLNYSTNGAGDDTLNDPNRTNAGANCSVPEGCGGVDFKIVISSGNQILVLSETVFMKP